MGSAKCEMELKIKYLNQQSDTPFAVSANFLCDAMREQFEHRAQYTKFVSRPTKFTSAGIVEYFDFDFELWVFVMGKGLSVKRDGYEYLFYK